MRTQILNRSQTRQTKREGCVKASTAIHPCPNKKPTVGRLKFGPATMTNLTRLLFVGDISLGGEYAERYGQGYPNWTKAFHDVRHVFQGADLRIGNLEEPLYRSQTPRPKRNLLGAPPESVKALTFLGFTALNLGNNHITDQGVEGVSRTREILESKGIAPFGAGENLGEARRPAFAEAGNQSFAFLGYAVHDQDVGSEVATDSVEGCVPLSLEYIEHDILKARRTAEHVVVSLHWGYQFDRYPAPDQVAIARRIIELGAIIVFGHHPHVLQGIERYKHGLILYSMGNFFFPSFVRTDGLKFRFPRASHTTAVVLCNVGRSGIQSFSMVPVRVGMDLRMKVLQGPVAAREERQLKLISEALHAPAYESLWRSQHRRVVKLRCRQEERFRARNEVVSLWREVRSRGLIGSLRRMKRHHIQGLPRLFRRIWSIF